MIARGDGIVNRPLAAVIFPVQVWAAARPRPLLPLQQDIWIGDTVQKGNGKYAAGDYTTILLDRPAASPCNDQVVTDILLGKGGAPDPTILLPYLNQRVAVKGRVLCPDTGIQFTPTPDFVFPLY
ncbi:MULTISPECIES: hypothetical protein [Paraburkholderia]|uniref:hypothetical protein n=1 Tax=Paraburkholderia TaxID=1822464 RepID=UPI00036E84B6|nr:MULTISPECIES: hypothetical protein [Paraburkholderia]MDH6147400.1 hypothetical protein [Paraburkholderia sp. WSM4179]